MILQHYLDLLSFKIIHREMRNEPENWRSKNYLLALIFPGFYLQSSYGAYYLPRRKNY